MRINPAEQFDYNQTHSALDAANLAAESMTVAVSIAGRLLAKRDQGNMIFGDVHDQDGKVQIVANADELPEYDDFKSVNVGDWLGFKGITGKTLRGEPSVFVDDWVRLARTERSFPDKRNGLRDPDTIARQRYLDLASNPVSMSRFVQRSKIVSQVRRILEDQDFLEVETPVLQTIYGGAAARPFETHHNALDAEMYLRIAPELYLKRLVVGGMKRVFEIGKVFRNEGISPRHNPEFTMMEIYAAYWDYEDQMNLTETMIANLAQTHHGSTLIEYQGQSVDLSTPWKRATMDELVSDAVGQPVSIDIGQDSLRTLCDQYDVAWEPGYGPGKLLLELYEKTVESKLWGPIFVTDYPKEVSPLARDHRSRPGYTERFEGIVAGRELCNGYTELNQAQEQYERFRDQELQAAHDDEAMPMDYDYVRALQYGLPPTAGLGIGIDRLVMLLTNAASIKDVILFPTLKPDNFTIEKYEDSTQI
jgi:lysyl-tRNA synthetase class 2